MVAEHVCVGVAACRRMWMLLQVHAKQCQNNDCPVPRCRELREMRRRAVARQEDQRRVAYQAMLRNQNGQVPVLLLCSCLICRTTERLPQQCP